MTKLRAILLILVVGLLFVVACDGLELAGRSSCDGPAVPLRFR